MAITNRLTVKQYSWQAYMVDANTILQNATEDPAVTLGVNDINSIQVFNTQASDNYDPTDEMTWNDEPIYSGILYLNNQNSSSDVVEFIRDQLQNYTPLFKNYQEVLPQYRSTTTSLIDGYWEMPTIMSKKSLSEINIFYVYITDPTNTYTLEIKFYIIPNNEFNQNNKYVSNTKLILTSPIKNKIAIGQIIPFSVYICDTLDPNSLTTTYYSKGGDSVSHAISNSLFTNSNNILCTHFINPVDTYSDYQNLQRLRIGYHFVSPYTRRRYINFDVEPCIEYVIYYKNLRGGWDWLLVNGSVKRSHKFNKNTYKNNLYFDATSQLYFPNQSSSVVYSVNNSILPNEVVYNIEDETIYKINLGWFTDDEVIELSNLFSSQLIYLHDLKNNLIIPVTLNEKDFEEKRYKDNKTINKYSITVTVNQNKNIK